MKPVKCSCGKLLARYENGVLYLWCKECKKEIAVPIKNLIDLDKAIKK